MRRSLQTIKTKIDNLSVKTIILVLAGTAAIISLAFIVNALVPSGPSAPPATADAAPDLLPTIDFDAVMAAEEPTPTPLPPPTPTRVPRTPPPTPGPEAGLTSTPTLRRQPPNQHKHQLRPQRTFASGPPRSKTPSSPPSPPWDPACPAR